MAQSLAQLLHEGSLNIMITSFFIAILLLMLLVQGSTALRLCHSKGKAARIPDPTNRLP
jgi:hypothetical protein